MRALLEPILKSHQTSAPPSSYAAVFQALTGTSLLKQGQQLHARFLLCGLRPDGFLSAKMVAMYASSGNIASASAVFRSASDPSPLLFNAIIRGLSLHKLSLETLQVHAQMRSLNFRGDHFTYPFVLKSAADLCFIDLGKSTHGLCLKDGLGSDMYVATSLIDMYVKCGQSGSARRLFDEMPVRDVSSWNVLISGYMRAGAIDLATELFNNMPSKNIVSWTTMISGFTQNGLASQALQLFDEMSGENSNIKPNWVTIMSVLPACGQSSALDLGKKIHNFARENRLDSHPSVQTALVGMYAKCGSLSDALSCFEKIKPSSRSLVTWNSMITAYASHGLGLEAVRTFEDMVKEGVHPDGVTFTGLLSGCSHAGLVDIGLKYFDSMSSVYFVEKRHEHYACTVDLLGRAGRLVEAYNLITQMPLQPEASVWGSLLASARCHRNLELAEMAARRLFVLEPENSGNYVVLSNMYAEAQMWAQVDSLRARLRSGSVKKNPGCSWIEIDGKAYLFLGGDVSHVQTNEIYLLLEELLEKMKAVGYMPETGFALHDVSEEEKEYSLIMHSEKLAIAFGLLNTEPGKVLRITKNLRICGDCHTTVKFISRIYDREIVVRDVNRFHHFREGSCSCDDYW
ncbi:Putative pentatricopeptide repeat-containing protein [Striga hermonthica]|uniref:Pentatricopeptide repeat-containing protein n=1 Tax=Striga hermonthica TaxID=68872 RepID=A0A9N7RTM6_STRHE|nr:Putative pentatricopeptide repeat-containing protein [Striga hermonthica]